MECTVPVEVELATDHADVGSLERTISAALAEVGTQLWRELVARVEAALPVPVNCGGCGGRLKANGRAPRRLVTLAARSSCAVAATAASAVGPRPCRSTPPSVSRRENERGRDAGPGCQVSLAPATTQSHLPHDRPEPRVVHDLSLRTVAYLPRIWGNAVGGG
jgi:hypothetical protein